MVIYQVMKTMKFRRIKYINNIRAYLLALFSFFFCRNSYLRTKNCLWSIHKEIQINLQREAIKFAIQTYMSTRGTKALRYFW